jgi:tRNA nucleotidyltransferase (CCA-adding enzyme)
MADYIYTMETRLTPEQQRAVNLVTELARTAEMNLYLTGGTIRDLVSGFPIRDVDLTLQGNPLKLQRDLERAGATVERVEDDLKVLYLVFPGHVRLELGMAFSATYEKPGKPPRVAPATITEDLRRRDFTVNAMALSLNPGSRGLLLDPANGLADIENKHIRILHNYAFLDDPVRLIRATRFTTRFHWQMEERTQARYAAAKENNYIEYIQDRSLGQEIEELAYEEDPLHILRALDKEGWLKVLHPRWSLSKVDSAGLGQFLKMRQQMQQYGYNPEIAPAVLFFLTRRMSSRDANDIQKSIPRRPLVEAWRNLDEEASELAHKLMGKEAATPSRAWHVLSAAKPESILFLEVTARAQSVVHKIRNFFGKWRQVRQKLPLPEMTELHITPALPAYVKVEEEAFYLLLDGKLRSRTELLKFLKPYAPPPPPPPPPPPVKRKGAKAEAASAAAAKGKGKAVAQTASVPPPAKAAPPPPKPAPQKPTKAANKPKPTKAANKPKPAKTKKKTAGVKSKGKKRRR